MIVMKFRQEPWFMEIFKMIRGFCLTWIGSCQNRSKVTSFSTQNTIFGKSSDYNVIQLLRSSFVLEFFISSFDLELVPKKPTSRSFRSEALTYGLAHSSDGDNRRTCHMMMYCFSLKNVMYPWEGIHKSFQFAVRTEYRFYSIEMEGKMADNNNKNHTSSI